MTESQRAIVAGRLATMPAHRLGKSVKFPTSAMSQPDPAKMLNVSDRIVRTARAVLYKGTPALVKKVEGGEVSVSATAEIAKAPAPVQEAIAALPPEARKVAAICVMPQIAPSDTAWSGVRDALSVRLGQIASPNIRTVTQNGATSEQNAAKRKGPARTSGARPLAAPTRSRATA